MRNSPQNSIDNTPANDILTPVVSKYINPMNDFFMRYLLGSKGSENNCRSFVNAVLQDIDFPAVSSLTILNPFNLGLIL